MKRTFSVGLITNIAALAWSGGMASAEGRQALSPRPATTFQQIHTDVIAGSVAIVAGALAVVVIAVVVHDHHTLKGCVASGPEGLELQTGDSETYRLQGASPDIKAGEMVKLHGARAKKPGGGQGHRVFMVSALKKDYGACRAGAAGAP